jgi:hypothetical protein
MLNLELLRPIIKWIFVRATVERKPMEQADFFLRISLSNHCDLSLSRINSLKISLYYNDCIERDAFARNQMQICVRDSALLYLHPLPRHQFAYIALPQKHRTMDLLKQKASA